MNFKCMQFYRPHSNWPATLLLMLLYSIKMYVIEEPDKLEKLGFESGSVWFVKYDFRDKPDSEIFYFSLF